MITNSNRAYIDKVLGCGVQEEVHVKFDSVYQIKYGLVQISYSGRTNSFKAATYVS